MAPLLCSAYLPPISHFLAMYGQETVFIEAYDRYRKQTYRNRCLIAAANGVQALTIPVVKPEPGQLMRDIRISSHGDWKHQHWNALASAYMNSPFFMYYQDDFRHIFEKEHTFLLDFNMELTETLLDLTGLKTALCLTDRNNKEVPQDLRHLINTDSTGTPSTEEYYQVFAQKNGFRQGLSMVDLLFNMGPESILVLKRANGLQDGLRSNP